MESSWDNAPSGYSRPTDVGIASGITIGKPKHIRQPTTHANLAPPILVLPASLDDYPGPRHTKPESVAGSLRSLGPWRRHALPQD